MRCLQMSFHQMMRFCVYLLEYVCSRGPLRLILFPALLRFISLTRLSPHLDAASPPHAALLWLARLARCTGDLLVCNLSQFKAAMKSSDVCWIRTGNMLDMTRSFATPLPLPLQPTGPRPALYALHPSSRLLLGGDGGEVDALIGNKRCAFLPFSFLFNMLSERTILGDQRKVC